MRLTKIPSQAFYVDEWYSIANGQIVLVDKRETPWPDIPDEMLTKSTDEAANVEVTFGDFGTEAAA